jgi:hypothetical protein
MNRAKMFDSFKSENLPIEQTKRTLVYRDTRAKGISRASEVPIGTTYNYDPRLFEPGIGQFAQSASAQEKLLSKNPAICRRMVNLKPLDIGFAIMKSATVPFDEESLGTELDEWCQHLIKLSTVEFQYSLNVFEFQGRCYSEEISKLWQLQAIERCINNNYKDFWFSCTNTCMHVSL